MTLESAVIIEIIYLVPALVLLYFAWQTKGSVRIPALCAGVLFLLEALFQFYMSPATVQGPNGSVVLWTSRILELLAIVCVAWLMSRIK